MAAALVESVALMSGSSGIVAGDLSVLRASIRREHIRAIEKNAGLAALL